MSRTAKRRWSGAWVVGGLVWLAACKPTVAEPTVAEPSAGEPAAVVTAPAPAPRNLAVELLEHAEGIERVDLALAGDGHKVVATIDASWVPRLKAQLVGAQVRDDLTNTPPAWKLGVRLFVDGVDAPFVGLPVGYDRLRLNPHDPWSPRIALEDGNIDPEILEVVVGEAFIEHVDALAFAAQEAPGKEHRPRP